MIEDHPLAQLFPLFGENEAAELADSIARSGQREDVILYEGKILDGRNRYRACVAANVKPRTRIFDPKVDGDPLQFVLDHNLHRRHLTTGQRAAIGALALKQMEADAKIAVGGEQAKPNPEATKPAADGENATPENVVPLPTKGQAAATMAKEMKVSERSIATAEKIGKEAPKKLQEVKDGKKSLNQAQKEIDDKKAKAERKKHVERIALVCGQEFATAVSRNTVLKTAKELAAFLALDDENMKAVQPLVSTGWPVKKALAHALNKITADSSIEALINKAIASGGEFAIVVNGFEISAMKVGE